MARVYKEEKFINKSIGKVEVLCTVTKKGYFKIFLPTPVVNALRNEYVSGYNLKEVEEEFWKVCEDYDILNTESELVIMYAAENIKSYNDGHGVGIKIFWAVYKKWVDGRGNTRYEWVRGMESHPAYAKDYLKGYNEMKWNKKREIFFSNIEKGLTNLRDNFQAFLGLEDIEDFIDKGNIPKLNMTNT